MASKSACSTLGAAPCSSCPSKDRTLCGAIVQALETSGRDLSVSMKFHDADAGRRVASTDEASPSVFAICRGWAFRFLTLPDGRRQIFDFLLAGDLFDPSLVSEPCLTSSIEALTDVRIVGFRRNSVTRLLASSEMMRSRWAATISGQRAASDGLQLALGQHSAYERVGYLIGHLAFRMTTNGPSNERSYRLPLKQSHIADALGLSVESVCRALAHFRSRGIFDLSHGRLKIAQLAELERLRTPASPQARARRSTADESSRRGEEDRS